MRYTLFTNKLLIFVTSVSPNILFTIQNTKINI